MTDTADERLWLPPETAISQLMLLQRASDKEWAHLEADRILCGLLNYLGHSDAVDAWDKVGKWYA